MNKINVMTFDEAIEKSQSEDRSLLLGNGFSQNLCKDFSYSSLLDIAKSKLEGREKLSHPLQKIFEELDTSDFEKVLANLEIAHKINKHYHSKTIIQKIEADLGNIRKCFVDSLTYIHPYNQNLLGDQDKKLSRSFLSHFTELFTTNYDLLIYWLTQADEIDGLKFKKKFDDGFRTSPDPEFDELVWTAYETQNIFFLHGALHIYEAEYVYKLRFRPYEDVLSRVLEQIRHKNYPLIVFEGKAVQKTEYINSSPYLWYCLERLKSIKNHLFIFGSSLNSYSDKHIVEAILKNNNLSQIFISTRKADEDQLLQKAKIFETAHKEVIFFDAISAFPHTGNELKQ